MTELVSARSGQRLEGKLVGIRVNPEENTAKVKSETYLICAVQLTSDFFADGEILDLVILFVFVVFGERGVVSDLEHYFNPSRILVLAEGETPLNLFSQYFRVLRAGGHRSSPRSRRLILYNIIVRGSSSQETRGV